MDLSPGERVPFQSSFVKVCVYIIKPAITTTPWVVLAHFDLRGMLGSLRPSERSTISSCARIPIDGGQSKLLGAVLCWYEPSNVLLRCIKGLGQLLCLSAWFLWATITYRRRWDGVRPCLRELGLSKKDLFMDSSQRAASLLLVSG